MTFGASTVRLAGLMGGDCGGGEDGDVSGNDNSGQERGDRGVALSAQSL